MQNPLPEKVQDFTGPDNTAPRKSIKEPLRDDMLVCVERHATDHRARVGQLPWKGAAVNNYFGGGGGGGWNCLVLLGFLLLLFLLGQLLAQRRPVGP